jgi:hypothetical protein
MDAGCFGMVNEMTRAFNKVQDFNFLGMFMSYIQYKRREYYQFSADCEVCPQDDVCEVALSQSQSLGPAGESGLIFPLTANTSLNIWDIEFRGYSSALSAFSAAIELNNLLASVDDGLVIFFKNNPFPIIVGFRKEAVLSITAVGTSVVIEYDLDLSPTTTCDGSFNYIIHSEVTTGDMYGLGAGGKEYSLSSWSSLIDRITVVPDKKCRTLVDVKTLLSENGLKLLDCLPKYFECIGYDISVVLDNYGLGDDPNAGIIYDAIEEGEGDCICNPITFEIS